MLTVCDLQAGYGHSLVVRGVHAQVAPGQIVALLGRNGSGRSTLAKALMALVPWRGTVHWRGHALAGMRTFEIARLGIGYVPETRDVFAGLSVHQYLLLGQQTTRRRDAAAVWGFDDLYRMFPALHLRRDVDAGVLSGGEQQMLSLCRTLIGAPELVIVDEPTEGLAPALVQQVASCLLELRRRGIAVLLIEQKLSIALAVSDRVMLMGRGVIVFDGLPQALQQQPTLVQEWLQV